MIGPADLGRRAGCIDRGGPNDDRRAADHGSVDPGRVGNRLQAGGVPPPDVHLSCIIDRVGRKDDPVVGGGQHAAHLEFDRRHWLVVDRESSRSAAIGGVHDATVGEQRRGAGHQLDPRRRRRRARARWSHLGRIRRRRRRAAPSNSAGRVTAPASRARRPSRSPMRDTGRSRGPSRRRCAIRRGRRDGG